jgi:hypothetical protein
MANALEATETKAKSIDTCGFADDADDDADDPASYYSNPTTYYSKRRGGSPLEH